MARSDDFKQTTKELLARRVGFHCSNPKCRHVTVGPSRNQAESINLGVAAHITAASKNGPRYDASLSSLDRQSPANGIWLCQSCSKLIDSDTSKFTREVLADWKETAEHLAAKENQGICLSEEMNIPQIDFHAEDWHTWIERVTSSPGIFMPSYFRPGVRVFSCKFRFRNRTRDMQLLTKLKIELNLGNEIVDSVDWHVFTSHDSLELPARDWCTADVYNDFSDPNLYLKASSVWLTCEIIGFDQRTNWKILDLKDPRP